MERKAFSFLRSFYESACNLQNNKELQADFLMAVCNYGLNGIEPEPGGEIAAMFALVKPNLDVAFAKSVAGAKGGSRNKANESNPEANESKPQANGSRNKANESNPEAIKDKGLRIKDKGDKNLALFESEFDRFWAEYPRKVAKSKAKAAFEKVMQKGVSIEALLGALRIQKLSTQWTKDGGQFIPHPTTWLNQERWEDEVDGGSNHGTSEQRFEDPILQRLWEQEQRHAL